VTRTPSIADDDLRATRQHEAEAASQRATAEARDYVLGQPAYLSSEVHDLLGGGADIPNKNEMAKRLRQGGQLLGIWNGHEFCHPKFQFTRTGQLDPRFEHLLLILPEHEDRAGWRRAFWLYFPNELLGDREPAAVWSEDPQSVLDAARDEFTEVDKRW
jgi:hypothetical protein